MQNLALQNPATKTLTLNLKTMPEIMLEIFSLNKIASVTNTIKTAENNSFFTFSDIKQKPADPSAGFFSSGREI